MSASRTALRAITSMARRASGSGLSAIPGVRRIYDGVYDRVARTGTTVVDVPFGSLEVDPRDRGVAYHLLTSGFYEPFAMRSLLARVPEGATVLDVGAQIGYYTIALAQAVGPDGVVVAFEPEPANRALLERNVERNRLQNVRVVPHAVGDAPRQDRLYTDVRNLGLPSLAEDNVLEVASSVDVSVVTIDDHLRAEGIEGSVAALKVDVQGAEAQVIAGARRLFEQEDLAALVEFWPAGIRRLGGDAERTAADLESRGFTFHLADEVSSELRQFRAVELGVLCGDDGQVNVLLTKDQGGSGSR